LLFGFLASKEIDCLRVPGSDVDLDVESTGSDQRDDRRRGE
jgi:hypothetical protein